MHTVHWQTAGIDTLCSDLKLQLDGSKLKAVCDACRKICLQVQLDACCMGRILTGTHAGVCMPVVHEQTAVVTLFVAISWQL